MARCLIVDDVTVSRFTVRSFIEELNIDVLEAHDKASALEALEGSNIDIVLLDWHLDGESGIDILKSIRDKYDSAIKVVMFSGVEDADKSSEVTSLGADGYLLKPTTKEK